MGNRYRVYSFNKFSEWLGTCCQDIQHNVIYNDADHVLRWSCRGCGAYTTVQLRIGFPLCQTLKAIRGSGCPQ